MDVANGISDFGLWLVDLIYPPSPFRSRSCQQSCGRDHPHLPLLTPFLQTCDFRKKKVQRLKEGICIVPFPTLLPPSCHSSLLKFSIHVDVRGPNWATEVAQVKPKRATLFCLGMRILCPCGITGI